MKLLILVGLTLVAVVCSRAVKEVVDPQAELEQLMPILKETEKLKAMFQRYKRGRDLPVLNQLAGEVNDIYDESGYVYDEPAASAGSDAVGAVSYDYNYPVDNNVARSSGSQDQAAADPAGDDSVAYYDSGDSNM